MKQPTRSTRAKYWTVQQVMDDTNLCRDMVVRLAKEAKAYLSFGRAVRIDTEKLYEYIECEYREE